MSGNSSDVCSHNNPDYVEFPENDKEDHWSGCAVPSDLSLANIVEGCCSSLGDGFQLTYQHWFQLVAETETDSVPCYTTCLTNVSATYYHDSQNITDCVELRATEEDVKDAGSAFLCAGPAMRTNAATRQFAGEPLAWSVSLLALIACFVRL